MADDENKPAEDANGLNPTGHRSYLARNWPIPTIAIGLAVLVIAFVYWLGPSRARHRDAFLSDLEQARAWVETEPYDARAALTGLLDRVWRAPEKEGEIQFLLGRSNEILGDNPDIEAARAMPYRKAALEAFQRAHQSEVSEELKLPLHESMGRMIVAVGKAKDLRLANSMLTDALRREEEVAWTIYRCTVHCLLALGSDDKSTLITAIEAWGNVTGVPLDRSDIAEEARRLSAEGRWQDLMELVNPEYLAFPDNPQSQSIDEEVLDLTKSNQVSEALSRLAERQVQTAKSQSRILESLARAAAASDPPALRDAAAWAKRRESLPSLTQEERDLARLDLAERWISADVPGEARRVLQSIAAENPRAAYLMAKSDLDEALRLQKMSEIDWIRSHPFLKSLAAWRSENSIRVKENSAWPPLLTRALDSMDQLAQPSHLKRLYSDALFHRSMGEFQRLLDRKGVDDELAAPARLGLGVALSSLGRLVEAEAELKEVCRKFGASPLEQAALFFLADLYRRDQAISTSIDVLRRAAETIPDPSTFENPYFGPEDLRELFIQQWTDYHNKSSDYDSALSVAELYRRFKTMKGVPPGQPDEFYADSSVELGRLALEESRRAAETEPALAHELAAWAHLREAGRAYRSVAQAREGSDEYPTHLWDAAVSLFDGHAYDEAIPIFQAFLVAHVGGPRDFPARLYLTRSYMAKLDYATARKILEESLRDAPGAVDRFRGRILLAQCYLEIARSLPEDDKEAAELLNGAEEILLANLNGQNQELEPSAAEWRDSLFVLGHVFFESKRYDAAISRLTEYIRRYPNEPGAQDAENYVGESFLASTSVLNQRIERASSERERARLRGERATRLEQSLASFRRLADHLLVATDKGRLAVHEELLLGNALFKIGRIYMMLGQRQEALDTFEDLAYRYQERPECLAAYVEMSAAYQEMDRPADAQSALRQALWILDRMDEQSFARSDRNRNEIRQQIQTLLAMP